MKKLSLFLNYRMNEMDFECRYPLLWNANGSIEVFGQDDISVEEAEKYIKLLKGEYSYDKPLPKSCAPSPSPSVDLSNETDYQERMSSLLEEKSNTQSVGFNMDEINYQINKQNLMPAAFKSRHHRHYNTNHKQQARLFNPRDQISQRQQIQSSMDRFYACHICDKRFSRKFNLNTHIKCVHSDDKDYICTFCQRAFNHSSNLRKHIKTVHGQEKRLPCPECKKPFKHDEALKSHLKVIHGKGLA